MLFSLEDHISGNRDLAPVSVDDDVLLRLQVQLSVDGCDPHMFVNIL